MKFDGPKDIEKSKLEQTTAVVVRGMRGMSSMGKPVNMRPISEASNILIGSAKASSSSTAPANEFMCTCATGWTGPTCEISKFEMKCL